ncbi:hypothetical protein [uncultured Pseudokineococcus sp.]|uniref:hypothetical protein n=1 Tax=uncultured Pseudokineococcus sp. TaxID=1642928 RepID=UPI00260B8887|nr:hypothetical protein [uncultured Pseudokineococcus sp.]
MGAAAVDTEQMAVVRARLEHVAADLEAVAASVVAAPALALGARRLVVALERAQEDWALHARALRRLADVAALDLGRAAAAYDDCEREALATARAAATGTTPVTAPTQLGPPVPLAVPLVGPPVPPLAPLGGLLGAPGPVRTTGPAPSSAGAAPAAVAPGGAGS